MKTAFARTTNVSNFVAAVGRLKSRQAGIPGMMLVRGEPGLGKTQAAIHYVANNAESIYIRATELMTPRWLLETIVDELHEDPERRTKKLFDQVTNRLIKNPFMIFVDEVDLLLHDNRIIEMLRSIHDSSGTPVVLMGMAGIDRKLSRYNHLADRFAEQVQFRELSRNDVRMVADQLCEVKLSDDACDFIYQKDKRLRQLIVWLYRAEHIANANSLKLVTAAQLEGK